LEGGSSTQRKQTLKETFGFDCTCEVCSLDDDKLRKSDARILRAEQLNETIGNWDSVRSSPAKMVRNGRKLLDIYNEEGIKDDRLPNLYYDIFQIVNMHGDQARASAFAQKYCDLKRLSEGPDSTNASEVMAYVKDPKKSKSFGETQDWKSSVNGVPKGLHEASFERWLWRENAWRFLIGFSISFGSRWLGGVQE